VLGSSELTLHNDGVHLNVATRAFRRFRARSPTSGVSIASPEGKVEDLAELLARLGARDRFKSSEIKALHLSLARIVGTWRAETGRLEGGPIVRNLDTIGRNLLAAADMMQAIESGFQKNEHIETTCRLAACLSLDPSVGSISKAQDLIAEFRKLAAQIGHASLIAAKELEGRPGERGRPSLDWHAQFTALLLEIADKASVKPTLGRDRMTDKRTGWLLKAARALEKLLPAAMRSQSVDACAQRLQRSMRQLKQRDRQK
jgi:hypothetical protein